MFLRSQVRSLRMSFGCSDLYLYYCLVVCRYRASLKLVYQNVCYNTSGVSIMASQDSLHSTLSKVGRRTLRSRPSVGAASANKRASSLDSVELNRRTRYNTNEVSIIQGSAAPSTRGEQAYIIIDVMAQQVIEKYIQIEGSEDVILVSGDPDTCELWIQDSDGGVANFKDLITGVIQRETKGPNMPEEGEILD